MQSTDRVVASGMVIAERYRLIEPLGAGGMGAVWRAEQLNLRSPVAVKLLNPAIADDSEMLERFLREAQSAAALRGSYVVQVFDYGVHSGLPFIAMELLSGLSLGRRLAAANVLQTSDLAWIFAQVSRAVSKAHELGIVHRDLKPDNIFIVRDGDEEIAKVLDFGIAKVLPSSIPLEEDNSQTTRTGTVLGTPFYMSPEQARGNKTVDYRADLWAMGVIAFECLTGRLPFSSSALGDLVVKICTHPTPLPSSFGEVPPGFDEWFARACEKSPTHRFQSMREQNDALQSVLGSAPALLSPNRPTPRGQRLSDPVLARDFGEFQTLESLRPAPAHTPPKPNALQQEAQSAATDSASSLTPVVSPATRTHRWVPALLLGTLTAAGLFALSRVNSPPNQPASPILQAPIAQVPSPLGTAPSIVASQVTTQAVTPEPTSSMSASDPEPKSDPATLVERSTIAPSESAPMDTSASSGKLPKKVPGPKLTIQTHTSVAPRIEPTAPVAVSTDPAGAPPPSPPPIGQADETPPTKGLFDDRE